MDIVETLKKVGVIPVIVIEDAAKAVPLARALVDGGLNVLEVTFRTKAAAESIAAIKREVPEAIVGAGTVITPEMAKAAKEAGAVFGVAPGFDQRARSESCGCSVDHGLSCGFKNQQSCFRVRLRR